MGTFSCLQATNFACFQGCCRVSSAAIPSRLGEVYVVAVQAVDCSLVYGDIILLIVEGGLFIYEIAKLLAAMHLTAQSGQVTQGTTLTENQESAPGVFEVEPDYTQWKLKGTPSVHSLV